MSGISLIINTKNEENFIRDCILSAKGIVNEIIVVDMYSTDKTVEIAQFLGAAIYEYEDCGYVEPARNFALSKASNSWILLLDADERISSTLAKMLVSISEENKYDCVKIPRKNIQFNKWIQHTGWWPDYQIRFFLKGRVTWKDSIHSAPEFTDNFLMLPMVEELAIIHYNFRSIQLLVDKISNYTNHEEGLTLNKIEKAKDFINYFEGEFKHRFATEKGFQDGMHGFMLSKFMEYYRFLEIAHLWEKNKYADITDVETLNKIILSRQNS